MASIPFPRQQNPFTPQYKRFGYIEALILVPAVCKLLVLFVEPSFDISVLFIPLYALAIYRDSLRLKQLIILSQIGLTIYNLALIYYALDLNTISYTVAFIALNVLTFIIISQQFAKEHPNEVLIRS